MTSAFATPSSGYFIDLETEYGAFNYKPLDVVLTRRRGLGLGRGWQEILDCLSAYSAVNQGHCHPEILRTMVDQAQR